ncbi:MAG TPA: hypothetical protein VLY24_12840 [Bryobacteraceae bacterium]|nr:hypothetical protein [Bryobacteraceae bacterium]
MRMRLACALLLVLLAPLAAAETASFSVILGGKNVGHLIAETNGDRTTVDYDFKNNGRGPTISEVIRSGPDGPSEVYPKFGIEPFTRAPAVKEAAEGRSQRRIEKN